MAVKAMVHITPHSNEQKQTSCVCAKSVQTLLLSCFMVLNHLMGNQAF